MPRHMTENASSCLDNLVLFCKEDNGQALVKNKYKKDHYNVQHQSLPTHHNQLLRASSDEIRRTIHHSIALNIDIQHDKFSKLEEILQKKKEACRNETDDFLKETYKKEVLGVLEESTSDIMTGKLGKTEKDDYRNELEKALQTKKDEDRNETDEFLKDTCKQEIQSLIARLAGALREADFQV